MEAAPITVKVFVAGCPSAKAGRQVNVKATASVIQRHFLTLTDRKQNEKNGDRFKIIVILVMLAQIEYVFYRQVMVLRKSFILCINLAVSQIIEPDWVWAAAHRNNITQDSATAA